LQEAEMGGLERGRSPLPGCRGELWSQEVNEPLRVQGRTPRFEPRTYCFLQRTLERGVKRGLRPLP